MGAVAPDRTSWDHAGVVESYAVTADVTVVSLSVEAVSGTCDRDNILDNGETGLLRIELRNLDALRTEQTVVTVTSSSPGVTLGHGGRCRCPPWTGWRRRRSPSPCRSRARRGASN
ncbi:hypothetical protein ACN28S_09600 [Cystobacter fuscus]